MSGYDSLLNKREVETAIAETFEAELAAVTGRSVQILSYGESPDCVAMIDEIETGLEFTAVHAGDAEDAIAELERLASKKHASYAPRGIFSRPTILLGHLEWPARDIEGPGLFDIHREIAHLADPAIFGFGFSETWLMDEGPKYTSRRDPRCPADFFCFLPEEQFGFWEHERKRRPYWSLITGG
jgi:hypothetical protein